MATTAVTPSATPAVTVGNADGHTDYRTDRDADTDAITHADTAGHRSDWLSLDLEDLPGYTAGAKQSDGSWLKTVADGKVRWWIYENGKLQSNYRPDETIAFGKPETFTKIEGVLTFRGNNYRNAPAWGTADISENKLEIVWTKDIGAISGTGSYWPGAGWTGQPLLVHWPEATRQVMGISQRNEGERPGRSPLSGF